MNLTSLDLGQITHIQSVLDLIDCVLDLTVLDFVVKFNLKMQDFQPVLDLTCE